MKVEKRKVKDNMKKVINPLQVQGHDVFCKIEIKDGNLSISGVIGPKLNGDAWGSCGQIDMDFNESYPETVRKYIEGWDKELFDKFLDVIDFLESLPETKVKPAWV
jgi:hypothetical protein